MGELHLEIYVERMKREYNVPCITGKPLVAFRECITSRANFTYTHKKQSGGAGQFAKVIGYIEPMTMPGEEEAAAAEGAAPKKKLVGGKKEARTDVEFENAVMGGTVPSNYIPAVEAVSIFSLSRSDHKLMGCSQGFLEACDKGTLSGNVITNTRMVLTDGGYHIVDSSELAFRLAAIGAFREAFKAARPVILEPIMTVEVVAPVEFQSTFLSPRCQSTPPTNFLFCFMFTGAVIGSLNTRRGTIVDSEVREEEFSCIAEVALNDMFGYSNSLRGSTQGKGEFSMEYKVRLYVFPYFSPCTN